MPLRPYQQKIVTEVRQAYASGANAPLIVLPTGGGKTALAADIVRRCHGRSVVWVAHREELCNQAIGAIEAAGVKCGGIGAELKPDPTASVQVCTIQTLLRRDPPPGELLIVDEAHHYSQNEFADTLRNYKRRLGLTATPQRADGSPMGDMFDHLVVGPSIANLTEQGYLVPCEFVGPSAPLGPGEIASSPVDAYSLYCAGRKTIVFAQHVKAAQEYVDEFVAAGVGARILHGKQSNDVRRRTLLDHQQGVYPVLVNCMIATEGYDDPSVECLVLARGVGSQSLWLQIIGRALRPSPGKSNALIVDLRGSVHVHGTPTSDREFSLDGDGIVCRSDAAPRFCPICSAPLGAGDRACTRCGYTVAEPESPEVVAAKMQKLALKAAEPEPVKIAKLAQFMVQARVAGYPFGYAIKKWTGVYGYPPPSHYIHKAKKLIP